MTHEAHVALRQARAGNPAAATAAAAVVSPECELPGDGGLIDGSSGTPEESPQPRLRRSVASLDERSRVALGASEPQPPHHAATI